MTNIRVQTFKKGEPEEKAKRCRGKRCRGKSTAQTSLFARRSTQNIKKKHTRAKFQREPRCKHYTNPKFVRRGTHNETRHISVQTQKGTEGKALHKPDVCEAKYAKHNMTNISVQTSKGTEGKHYTNPAFERGENAKL